MTIKLCSTDLRRIADHLDGMVDAHNKSGLAFSPTNVEMTEWPHALTIEIATVKGKPPKRPVVDVFQLVVSGEAPESPEETGEYRTYVLVVGSDI